MESTNMGQRYWDDDVTQKQLDAWENREPKVKCDTKPDMDLWDVKLCPFQSDGGFE